MFSPDKQITLQLCNLLVQRQRTNQIFLQRTWRSALREPSKFAHVGERLPTVRYVCGHKSVLWRKDIPDLRCLFCCGLASVRFTDEVQLLEHLRACHGRFRYVLEAESRDSSGVPFYFIVEVSNSS